MATKTYSSKSNAKRAAVAAGLDMNTAVLVEVDGKFVYEAAVVVSIEPTEIEAMYIARHGFCKCPRCEVGLDNGVMDFDSLEAYVGYAKAYAAQAKMFACMACDYEWGEEMPAPGAKRNTVATGTGIKIQKERAEANGVVRPSVGGACDAVWSKCDALAATGNGLVPSIKEIKAWAVEAGVHATTATIQYYQWRKFVGIVGRAKEMPAQ